MNGMLIERNFAFFHDAAILPHSLIRVQTVLSNSLFISFPRSGGKMVPM
jgi:hypothetical protein